MNLHTFHIPVMGIGFTIDTPIKVAKYGISSVISLVDDCLIEKIREFYCKKMAIPFAAIGAKEEDSRAKRITSYLNLVNRIVEKNFKELKASPFNKGSEIIKYLEMLPEHSKLRQIYNEMLQTKDSEAVNKMQIWLKKNLIVGSIDVNIMTKVDKINHKGGEVLPSDYNDAHAALRGFAVSDLHASIVLSAGINTSLYSHMACFNDFYPDKNYFLKKKIILKVSDFRSAVTQGKFLAKKGLWVSEYRIESGLNCGGHAFPTQGHLLGPILEKFKEDKEKLISTTHNVLVKALKHKNKPFSETPLNLKITIQGGITTSKEHDFLLNYYNLDSTGWGTPFLLVPEVTNVDPTTLELLCNALEDDLYLSHISPLGVPFNTVRGNTKDKEKQMLIEKGRPGSICPKKFLVSNTEFTKYAICTASSQYQRQKIKELKKQFSDQNEYQKQFNKIVEKACICVGLGTSALLVKKIDAKLEGKGVSICPGPIMAYFSKIVSLKEMVDHIYGRINLIKENNRPHMFIKELELYMDYLKKAISETLKPLQTKEIKYFESFHSNLQEGI
ncbi:MAG: hypothetical protein J7K84_04145, partial [Deltaproteobacteria bacterium]|nr:hypothetical protein [Deltaproteobacteria bacterium]